MEAILLLCLCKNDIALFTMPILVIFAVCKVCHGLMLYGFL